MTRCRPHNIRVNWTRCIGIIPLAMMGCTSPPSVVPLLDVVEQALRHEATLVHEEADREAQTVSQTRTALDHAFDADLQAQSSLDEAWVRDAVRVYAAAREAVVRHELDLRNARNQRADNLLAAADAQRRAIELLQQQDELIKRSLDLKAWRGTQIPNE